MELTSKPKGGEQMSSTDFPTAKEIMDFAQRLNGVSYNTIKEVIDFDDINSAANFLKRCAGGVEKASAFIASESCDIVKGQTITFKNCKPKYLSGIHAVVKNVEKRKNETVIWSVIVEETGQSKTYGHEVGFALAQISKDTTTHGEELASDFLNTPEGKVHLLRAV
tara:strand:+ start:132 stop:629 length:498 start_codon:yes stop_codon:yes gene_type:complete